MIFSSSELWRCLADDEDSDDRLGRNLARNDELRIVEPKRLWRVFGVKPGTITGKEAQTMPTQGSMAVQRKISTMFPKYVFVR